MAEFFHAYATDDDEGGIEDIYASSMDDLMDAVEEDYGEVLWETPLEQHRGRFQTGRILDYRGTSYSLILSRVKVPARRKERRIGVRVWKARTDAYRTLLGTITRTPYIGGATHVYGVECVRGDYENSSKAWDEKKAKRALSDHWHAKHGLAKEDY